MDAASSDSVSDRSCVIIIVIVAVMGIGIGMVMVRVIVTVLVIDYGCRQGGCAVRAGGLPVNRGTHERRLGGVWGLGFIMSGTSVLKCV